MRKGFTLVELLAVIIILGVLALITYPIIDKSIKQSKEKALEKTIASVIEASINYSIQNDLGYNSNYKKLKLETLIEAGFLKKEIINPITNQKLQGCVLYKWDNSYNQYEFEYSETCEILTLTLKDIVLSNFPYLEVGENGCKNPGDNNYSYMGGCYLKGAKSGKDVFYIIIMNYAGLSNATITKNFFDSYGNFLAENFENWALENLNVSQDDLIDAGVNTVFELLMLEIIGVPLTSEELFSQHSENNYIWYSGFLWRIMGINVDGTVRLITDENVTAIPWGKENTTQNWDESHVKDWLNNYFYPRLKDNDIISEQIWCSENAIDILSSRTQCSKNLSTKPSYVGLMTLDEYNLAGGVISYLDIGQVQLTMTPYDNSNVWNIIYTGSVVSNDVSQASGLRAVINVNSNVIITGGNGTIGTIWNNEVGPYILNEDKNIEVIGKLNEKSTSGEYVMFARKKYRIVDKDSNGNTKLILDGYYEENGNIFEMEYGNDNVFSPTTGIGQKLNTNVLNWITNNNDTEKAKLVSDYTWYQNNFDSGYDYKISLDEESPTRSVNATIGLIRVGEMLSGQSSSILTKGYTTIGSYINTSLYWTMTPSTSSSEVWHIDDVGLAESYLVSSLRALCPVIVINSGVTITGGNGTWSNPYTI